MVYYTVIVVVFFDHGGICFHCSVNVVKSTLTVNLEVLLLNISK